MKLSEAKQRRMVLPRRVSRQSTESVESFERKSDNDNKISQPNLVAKWLEKSIADLLGKLDPRAVELTQ